MELPHQSLKASQCWLVGVCLIALLHWLGSFWVPSRGELFWMLFPIDVLILAYWLKVLPKPQLSEQPRWQRIASGVLMVTFPILFYFGLTWLCQSPFSLKECLIAEYFFVFCLEAPLLYMFTGLEILDRKIRDRQVPLAGLAGRLGLRVIGYQCLIPVLMSILAIHRPKLLPVLFAFAPQELARKVCFPSRDASPLTLRGEFVTHPEAQGTVIGSQSE